MKFIFSLLLAFSAYGNNPIIITHFYHPKTAEMIRSVLHKEFNIPTGLIEVNETVQPCDFLEGPLLHLCISKDKSIIKKKFLKAEFERVFYEFLQKKDLQESRS